MMFELDLPSLKKNMTLGNGEKVQHNTGNKIRLFPFTTSYTENEELTKDLRTFKGIAGGCFRECLGYSQSTSFDKEDFLEAACERALAPGNSNLKDILDKVAFDENGQLIIFNARIFPYLGHYYAKSETLNNIAKYIVNLFVDEEGANRLRALVAEEPGNLMHRLILSCLPEPKQEKSKGEPYYKANNKARLKFTEDLVTLTKDPDLFTTGFQRLLQLYFFQYVTALSFQLNSFFEENEDHYFFSLHWEKLQASRLASTNGWELFEERVNNIFAHANTLELLNHIKGLGEQGISYRELRELVEQLSPADKAVLLKHIEAVIHFYTHGVTGVNWEKFECDEKYPEEPVYNAVHKLWQMVDFQFQHSGRNSPHRRYRKWFTDFAKFNFARGRGRNGYSLSLDKESVLFLTKLSIGHQTEKIRLSKLWQEFEERGFLFDQLSKEAMGDYFEKINLLEKKSDSGDAQYVRKLR